LKGKKAVVNFHALGKKETYQLGWEEQYPPINGEGINF
jgi:hypothetical protein